MTDRIGEGSYEGAEQFDKAQTEFSKDGGKVDRKAREAADALDGDEAEELRKAEQETGKRGQES